MIALNHRDGKPIYLQIIDGFRHHIALGILEADEKLPSVRELATQLAINPNTIQRAYRELEAQGLTYSIVGKGSFVAPKVDQMEPYRQAQRDKISEAVGELRALGMKKAEVETMLSTVLKEEFEK